MDYMLFLVKNQLFYDGNKRIAMMIENKVLITHGCGILSVDQGHLELFLHCSLTITKMKVREKFSSAFFMMNALMATRRGCRMRNKLSATAPLLFFELFKKQVNTAEAGVTE